MKKFKESALFLIDGSYLLYRSYYGLRPLQTSKGVPTQAIYGFCRAIKKLVDDFDPKHLVLLWDSKGKTFRSEIYKEYKATRQAPPSDLFVQKEKITEFADLIDLFQLAKPGYEADDLIGSIVNDFNRREIVIVGPDKDLYQLLSDRVSIFDPFKDRILDHETLKKEKGFGAEKVAFFYSLLGDSSDNIPGVKGVGKKTASELVKKFDSLDDLYKNLDKVKKGKLAETLDKYKEDAFLSFKLFLLKDCKLSLKEKDFEFNKNNWVNAVPLFQELEFKSLLKDIEKRFGVSQVQEVVVAKSGQSQMSLFDTDEKIISKTKKNSSKWNCIIIQTKDGLDKLISLLKKSKEFAFDTETTGIKALQDELVGFSFAVNKKDGYYVPLAHKAQGDRDEEQLDREFVLEKLKPIFENSKIKKILHHTKFDQLIVSQYGIEIKGIVFDTLIVAHLLKKRDEEKINLKVLSLRYLNEPMTSFKDVMGKKYKNFSQVPISIAAEYGAHDALQTFKLKQILEKDLKKEKKLHKIFYDIELPLSQLLYRMEQVGITLDADRLKVVGKHIDKDLNKIEKKVLAAIAHHRKTETAKINLNSPQQVEKFLFDELDLPVIKKSGKGKRSTDQWVLSELSKINPIPGLILKYRELAKLRSTYIGPLIKEINTKTGRVHTSFSQTMTATGRLASSRPNLQNIPAGKDHGIKIRSAFVAPRGYTFLAADYSQVELRVLAHITKDKNLKTAFLHDKDIHALTASQIFDVAIDKVTYKQRQIGKRINFGIAYGQTPFGLSRELGIKPSEAKEYIEKYFQQYAGVAKWIEKNIENTKENGYTQTWLGRRRYLPGINEKNNTLYQAARRMAINSPVQGTSAEIIKLAMLELDKELKKHKVEAKMILQIHDELILELPTKELEKVKKIVKKCMENVVEWEIPFKVDMQDGKSWDKLA